MWLIITNLDTLNIIYVKHTHIDVYLHMALDAKFRIRDTYIILKL